MNTTVNPIHCRSMAANGIKVASNALMHCYRLFPEVCYTLFAQNKIDCCPEPISLVLCYSRLHTCTHPR